MRHRKDLEAFLKLDEPKPDLAFDAFCRREHAKQVAAMERAMRKAGGGNGHAFLASGAIGDALVGALAVVGAICLIGSLFG